MGSANFKQYDSRWGRKNYNGSSTMATAGCGPTSVANIVHNIDPNIDPWKVAKWMKEHGYAIRNHGTAWAGIPAAMKHYGFEDVHEVVSMSDVFSYIAKGYKAIFLFSAGKRGGVTWTTSGHFIAVTSYKHENGKHYFWTRDSGGRNHTGWYCYETQMRGLIPQVWVGKVPIIKPKKKETYKGFFPVLPERGYFKRGDEGAQVRRLQEFLNWALKYSLSVDGDLGAKTVRAIMAFENRVDLEQDGKFGKKCLKAAKKFKV